MEVKDFTQLPDDFNPTCTGINYMNYQHMLAFVFAITEINRNPQLLPNVTLGFHIVDSCLTERPSVTGMFDIISGKKDPIPNYHCDSLHKLVAVVEGISSKISLLLARMFGLYNIPQIHKALKYVHFLNNAGTEVYFDEKGDMNSTLDVLNWIEYPNQTLDGVKVGRFDQKHSTQNLVIDENLIRWNIAFNKTPQSVCSKTCLPGYRKSTGNGSVACCYECIPCREGEISNETDMERCRKCPEDQWPNLNRDTCIFKVISYLSYREPLGEFFTAVSIVHFFVTCVITAFFTKHRNTRVMKANNQIISYFLLISLKMCFLCSLIFIGHPIKATCFLRQTIFGITFTFAVSSVLAKTVTVIIAFNATRPGSKWRNLLGTRLSISIVIFCSLCQLIICALWLGIAPPFPFYNMKDEIGTILAVCNEGSLIGFYCVLGFMGFLSFVCFLVAFLSRNLPDIFNEAKFITFSMLVFCSVWISFIPAYLSTRGKYVVAVEIFAILTSSCGLVVCIFIPKCYFVLFRPELTIKDITIQQRT
ncbi:vomeronasal type-2 receptor 26-like [Mixophyes fleayi]|uniref:vomeronasal type-2 receptor 26-like n=1 Tax=Mixophyes fleayi TaxID=3061075 RepID=UPI003F4DDF35